MIVNWGPFTQLLNTTCQNETNRTRKKIIHQNQEYNWLLIKYIIQLRWKWFSYSFNWISDGLWNESVTFHYADSTCRIGIKQPGRRLLYESSLLMYIIGKIPKNGLLSRRLWWVVGIWIFSEEVDLLLGENVLKLNWRNGSEVDK